MFLNNQDLVAHQIKLLFCYCVRDYNLNVDYKYFLNLVMTICLFY